MVFFFLNTSRRFKVIGGTFFRSRKRRGVLVDRPRNVQRRTVYTWSSGCHTVDGTDDRSRIEKLPRRQFPRGENASRTRDVYGERGGTVRKRHTLPIISRRCREIVFVNTLARVFTSAADIRLDVTRRAVLRRLDPCRTRALRTVRFRNDDATKWFGERSARNCFFRKSFFRTIACRVTRRLDVGGRGSV